MFPQKWIKILKKIFCPSFVYGQKCFVPKNHKNWPYRFGDIATIPSKTWFFTILTFLAFLTHPNVQKMFRRARSQFFHVLKHQKIFVKIGAPLVQKCLALPEYSHHEAFLAPFSKKVKKFHNFKIFEIFLAEN